MTLFFNNNYHIANIDNFGNELSKHTYLRSLTLNFGSNLIANITEFGDDLSKLHWLSKLNLDFIYNFTIRNIFGFGKSLSKLN